MRHLFWTWPSGGGARSMGSAPGGPALHGDSATSSPRALPAQRAHAARSALPCLHRSCFSLRCACESCSLVFADLPSPSRPSAVPARRELGLCLVAALQFVMLYLRVVPTPGPTTPSPAPRRARPRRASETQHTCLMTHGHASMSCTAGR